MPMFKTNQVIAAQIDEFFDTVARGALVFRSGIQAYLAGDVEGFRSSIEQISTLESSADSVSSDVETHLYSHALIPEHRGDVLGLLENTDNIIDTAKTCLYQFSVEQPEIPAPFTDGYLNLTEASYAAVEAVIVSARAFFRDPSAVKDNLYKVHHHENQADIISDRLKRAVFASDLDLAHKIHLRYFALNIERVSDEAEQVADRLAIYAIKRNI